MNKISAALNINQTLHATASDNVKTADNNDANNDEYHTIFSKRLSTNDDLNSTTTSFINDIEPQSHQTYYSLDDFIGGPINDDYTITSDYGRQSRQSNSEQNSDFIRSITATPADSSCGFQNTFSILEKHLKKNKQLKLSRQQIEYLLEQNKETAIQNDIYIDIPIDENRSLHTINGPINGLSNDVNDFHENANEMPSLFELEFEAMERLRAMWGDALNYDEIDSQQTEKDSLNTICNNSDASLVEELYQQDEIDFNKSTINNDGHGNESYIYHVAKSRNGQLYIRVRRNLRLDQGKSFAFCFCLRLKEILFFFSSSSNK